MARRILAIAVISGLLLALIPSGLAQTQSEIARRNHLMRILPMLSGRVMLRLADRLGVTNIQGKALIRPVRSPTRPGGKTGTDAPIPGFTAEDENEPSIAVNPQNPNQLVAFMHRITATVECVVFYSANGGASWSSFGALPLRFPSDSCSDPVVRWSGDGTTVYASYISIRGDDSTSDIVVSRSTDGGMTWTGPGVALPGTAPDFLDKPWMGTHGFDAGQSNWVYVTATNFRGNGNCDIQFAASSDNGATFSAAPTTLASSAGCNPVVQGSNVAGGVGPVILACWYHSGTDGWLRGRFGIRCRSSGDNGGTWAGEVAAIARIAYELPYWMCPNSSYYRLWGAMFPQVRISPDGRAHVVFTRDPTAGAGNGECGDIAYIRSGGYPYATWSSPVKISSGSGTNKTAQNYVTITVEGRAGTPGYRLYAAWVDQRLSLTWSANIFYDIFRTHSDNGGGTWTANVRVTTASSLTDYTFIGDYIDSASTVLTDAIRTHLIWTDRRDKTSFFEIFDPEDDVFYAGVP